MRQFRILVAPAAFKGSLSAWDAAYCIADYLQERLAEQVEIDLCPVADGGDDTLSVLQQADPGFVLKSATVMGPLPDMTVEAHALVHTAKKLAVLEAAQAHGYRLLANRELAPMEATSYGVGQLLKSVLMQESGIDTLVIALGGSASTDGGLGALQALGVSFLEASGKHIERPISGGSLSEIGQIEWLSDWAFPGKILIATDVENPLLGPSGTATVFAPQKGADPLQCETLERNLTQVSRQLTRVCGVDDTDYPGVGAAGGLAYGLKHLPRSEIVSGSQWIGEALDLEKRIQRADMVITAEGRLDATSISGKATGNLLAMAGEKPVFILCGQMEDGLTLPDNVHPLPFLPADATHAEKQHAIQHPKDYIRRQLEKAWLLMSLKA